MTSDQVSGTRDQGTSVRGRGRRCRSRRGALLSAELLLVAPVLVIALFGIIEMSLLTSTASQLRVAANLVAREASVTAGPTNSFLLQPLLVQSLGADLAGKTSLTVVDSGLGGELLSVTLSLPRADGAPDLLGVVGLSLSGDLEVTIVARKEGV